MQTQATYEKEIRKARKEAFKSSSTVVKLQEELKSAKTKDGFIDKLIRVITKQIGQDSNNMLGFIRKHR